LQKVVKGRLTMPVYKLECPFCLHTWDEMRTIAKRNDKLPCPHCKVTVEPKIIIDACPNMHLAFPGSFSHKVRRIKADQVPEQVFYPYNGTDTVPGPEITGAKKEKRYL
jgi:hypothetical protein